MLHSVLNLSFPSHKAHGVALITISRALSQTPAYTETTDMGLVDRGYESNPQPDTSLHCETTDIIIIIIIINEFRLT